MQGSVFVDTPHHRHSGMSVHVYKARESCLTRAIHYLCSRNLVGLACFRDFGNQSVRNEYVRLGAIQRDIL